MAKKPSKILKDAAERIRGKYLKGDYHDILVNPEDIDTVSVCAYGALQWASELPFWAHPQLRVTQLRRERYTKALNYARAQCAPLGLSELNDYIGTTEMHMRNLLLLAAKEAIANGD